MKFRDGYWGLKKGVFLRNPIELRDTDSGTSKLTLWVTSLLTDGVRIAEGL